MIHRNCRCEDNPWIRRANDIIDDSSIPLEQIETLKFLLENGYCGMRNRVKEQKIVDHLNTKGFRFNKETFQTRVFTELKRRGVVVSLIYPGPQGGVFIPCNETELIEVAKQVFDRVIQQLVNLEGMLSGTSILTQVEETTRLVKSKKDRL